MSERKKILIIEDNPDLVEMYKIKFRNEGFEVFTAINGEEGVVKVVQNQPEIVLLDILMPNMNGFEVLKAIKENTSLDVKIIVLSNLGQQGQIDKAYELGATYYMVKANYTPAEVVKKVKEYLGEGTDSSMYIKVEPAAHDYEKLLSTLPADLKMRCMPESGGEVLIKLTPKGNPAENSWDAEIKSAKE